MNFSSRKSYITVLYGLDNDVHAKAYSMALSEKYRWNDGVKFLDVSAFNSKLYPIKVLSKLSVVSMGIHSNDIPYPSLNIELEVCGGSICQQLGEYLRKRKLIDRLVIIHPDVWKLPEYPENFSFLEIFPGEGVFSKFERMFSSTLDFLKENYSV
jgi:hypothetical protein